MGLSLITLYSPPLAILEYLKLIALSRGREREHTVLFSSVHWYFMCYAKTSRRRILVSGNYNGFVSCCL